MGWEGRDGVDEEIVGGVLWRARERVMMRSDCGTMRSPFTIMDERRGSWRA